MQLRRKRWSSTFDSIRAVFIPYGILLPQLGSFLKIYRPGLLWLISHLCPFLSSIIIAKVQSSPALLGEVWIIHAASWRGVERAKMRLVKTRGGSVTDQICKLTRLGIWTKGAKNHKHAVFTAFYIQSTERMDQSFITLTASASHRRMFYAIPIINS